jgi:hypothetical protein
MSDRDIIVANLRTQEPKRFRWHPTKPNNKEEYTPEEYETSIQESADMLLKQQQIDQQKTAERPLIDEFNALMEKCRLNTATAAEVRRATYLNMRFTKRIATELRDS